MKKGKGYRKFLEALTPDKEYELGEAMDLIKKNTLSKFDNTLEIHLRLGVDPKQSDQAVRGNVVLPHGTGKSVKVLVFAKGEMAKTAEATGADFVGAEDMIEKINQGWMEFDRVVATPDMMPLVGRVAKILGPRGLMPNPKTGTVTVNVGEAIRELKAGKLSYRIDKGSNLHAGIGKLSFEASKLVENAKVFIDSVLRAKPPTSKGEFVRSAYLAATMGPSLKLTKNVVR